jgi:putative FmdB family regulatory protein
MPIYEFMCAKCGHVFESLVGMGRDKDAVCPKCGAAEVQKLLSSFGIGGGGSRLKSASSGCTTCSTKTCSTCH